MENNNQLAIDNLENEYFEIFPKHTPYHELPLASAEITAGIEAEMIKKFSSFLGKIKNMSEYRFDILIDAFMGFDFRRGLMLGMVPQYRFEHSEEFKEFESQLLDEINERLVELNEEKKNKKKKLIIE